MFKNYHRPNVTFWTAVAAAVAVVAAAAAAAAAVAPKGEMWDGTRPKGGSFKRSKGRQSATSRVLLLSTG